MQDNSTANPNRASHRTSLSLIVSTLLHGSVIALIAVGPAFLPQLKLGNSHSGLEQPQSITVETIGPAVSQTTPADLHTLAVPEPVATPPTPAAVAQVTPPPTTISTPTPAPVALIAKPRQVATSAPRLEKAPTKLPEKPVSLESDIAPQPVVAVDETAQETVSVVDAEPVKPVAPEVATAAPEVAVETTPDAVEATPSIAENSVAAAEVSAPPAEAQNITPAPVAVPLNATTAPASAPAANSALIGSSDGSVGSAPATIGSPAGVAMGDTATAAEPIKVTQSYLGLKQMPGNKPPNYSREMRLKRSQGRGQLVYFVNKEGQVSQLRLTQSTGEKLLDQAAIEAFSRYKFVPGQEGYTVHDFEFSLKGPEVTEAGRLRTSINK